MLKEYGKVSCSIDNLCMKRFLSAMFLDPHPTFFMILAIQEIIP